MNRRLFTILSALSGLLFLAVVVLWVRSYRHGQVLSHRDHRHLYTLRSASGRVGAFVMWDGWFDDYPAGWSIASQPAKQAEAVGSALPDLFAVTWRGGTDSIHVTLPYTYLSATTLAVPTVLWLVPRVRRARRVRVSLCPACGYDLRATPGRCPECGAAPAKAPA